MTNLKPQVEHPVIIMSQDSLLFVVSELKDNLFQRQDLLSSSLHLLAYLILSIMDEHLQTLPCIRSRASEIGVQIKTAPYKPSWSEIGGAAKTRPSLLCLLNSVTLLMAKHYRLCHSAGMLQKWYRVPWHSEERLVPGAFGCHRLDTLEIGLDHPRVGPARRNCTPQP